MITCTSCDTAQFLKIIQSRIYFEDGELVSEVSESYECTVCGATGQYTYDDDEGTEQVTGELEQTTERPKYA